MEINQGESLSAFIGSDHPYHIPKYQRPYCWTTEVEDLWFDLVSLVRNNEQSKERNHFFGQIVVHIDDSEDETKYYIVDGQQRTVTSIIFLAVLRDIVKTFEGNENPSISEAAANIRTNISHTLLSSYSVTSDELIYKFVFENTDDMVFFRDNIQKCPPHNTKELRVIPAKAKSSQECIENAYWYLYTSLNDLIVQAGGNTAEAFTEFKKFHKAFLNKFTIINLETKDLSDAYDIFESLNARGKDLDTSDLLKNYMFKTVGKKDEDLMSKYWDRMSANLKNASISSYIRCYWNSMYSFSRERELYRNIRREIDKDAKKCSDFIKGLADESELYAELLDPKKNNSQYFNTTDTYEIRRSIIGLKKMKSILYFPLMLALIRKEYKPKYIKKVMQVIETIIFRNIVVSGEKSNFLETKFADLAVTISQSNKELPIADIIGEIIEKIKTDDAFKADLSAYDTDKKEMIRYIFWKINTFELQKTSHEINLCENNFDLQIEHIMPENPAKGWEHISREDHEKYLWNLGNLSLLDSGLNDMASNKPFDKKVPYYTKSLLWSNKMLCDENTYPVWNIDMIKKRKDVLINEALSVWPRNYKLEEKDELQ